MDSDDDTPLDSLLNRKPKLQTQQKTQLFTRWQSITDKVFAIKVQNTTASELTPANRTLLEENLDYDESKYSVNLTNVILVQLIEKPNENENRDENKENEPVSSENKLQEIRENGIQEIEDSGDEKDSESGQEKKTSNAGSVNQIENIPEDESDDDNFVIDMIETVDPETLPEAMKDKSSDSIEITKSRPSSPVGESSISQPKIKGDEDKESQKSLETNKTTQRTEPSSSNSNELSGAPKNTDNQENVPVVEEILDSITDPLSAQENEDDLVEVVSDRPPPEIDTFWCLENCKISGLKSVPPSFQSRNNPGSPNVDFSVGGLYYKIYAAIQERRHASNLIIRPTFISHKRLYLAIEQKNYSNTSAFMEAAKEAYLDKMVEEDINMSASTFCRECFRVFSTPFDLQVHKELVHNIQHAATCRICEYNFGQPSILLKHMAAVHSRPHNATQGGREIMGAYKCQLCKFCSPLYSELIRHFKDYHANSGWLLCPFCTRCFSSDVQYENHLQLHINKEKFFRCQSCRLVFESETSRSRHEIEMHGRAKWLQVEANPCVPAGIKVWVRGEADSRSKIVDCEGLKDDQAVRALCLRDCTNHSSKQTFSGGKRKALPKGVEKLIPKHLIVAKKAFREEVLTSQRRSQAAPTKEMTEEETAKQEEGKELKKLIREKEDESGRLMPNRLRNSFEHQMCELVYYLSGAKDEEPEFPIQPQMKELCDIKIEILEKNELEQKLKIEQSVKQSNRFFDFKTDPMFAVPELKKEKSIFDIERENEELKKKGAEDMAIEDRNMDGKYYECIECKSRFDTGAELVAHFSLCPIRTKKGEWDTSCPVLAADRKSLETNDSAPSLLKFLTPVLEPVWNNEPREDIRRSYPEGVMSSSGKQWHDFTDATSIVRHLQKYPKNSLIITESQEHKDAVYEGKHRKRLKQMIQAYASQNQQVADLDKSMIQGLTDKLTMKKKFIEDEDEIEEHMENMPSDLKKLHGVLTFKKREPELPLKDRPLHREERQIMVAADGPNFETVIGKRQLSSPKIPRKVERALQSIFKKKQLDIKSKQQLESQNKQQQLASIKPNVTKAVAYKQNANAYWSTSQQNLHNKTNVTSNLTQGYRSINGTQNSSNINENGVRLEYAQQAPRASQNNYHQYSNNSQIPQRRPANQNTGPRAKTATLCGRLPRNAATLHLPVSPAGCKFPIVTHKSIHVEIIPSEDAKKFANVDQYEIQFKGKKSPNVYKVRPSIKVVKLIGLQSDTLYEIKIYATRHGVRSQPLIKSVLTPKKPKGVIAAGEVIELD